MRRYSLEAVNKPVFETENDTLPRRGRDLRRSSLTEPYFLGQLIGQGDESSHDGHASSTSAARPAISACGIAETSRPGMVAGKAAGWNSGRACQRKPLTARTSRRLGSTQHQASREQAECQLRDVAGTLATDLGLQFIDQSAGRIDSGSISPTTSRIPCRTSQRNAAVRR